jgi:hypothetical protein
MIYMIGPVLSTGPAYEKEQLSPFFSRSP